VNGRRSRHCQDAADGEQELMHFVSTGRLRSQELLTPREGKAFPPCKCHIKLLLFYLVTGNSPINAVLLEVGRELLMERLGPPKEGFHGVGG